MSLDTRVYRGLFHLMRVVGQPIGGVRPRRLYDVVGQRAYPSPAFRWHRNRWGDDLHLSPHLHIDRQIIAFGCYDPDLHRVLERMVGPGMVCFDVGANLGEMALHMARRVGAGGQVHAFEPVPHIAARLREHVARNAGGIVRVHELALSDATGQTEIAFPPPTAENQGLGSIVNLTAKAGGNRTVVETVTLDDMVARLGVDRLDLMKIDIQGAEPRLLAGGRRTLTTLGPDLILEVSPDDLRQAGTDSRVLCGTLESLGYTIRHLARGRPGAVIRAADVAPDFEATNVFCTRRGT